MAAKTDTHNIEKRGKNNFQVMIDNNDATLFRELSGRDYGIDGIVELFANGNPTGEICYIQIKTTSAQIEELKKEPGYISCHSISESNMCYCRQNRIPIFLIYNSLKEPNEFYYKLLNNYESKHKTVIKMSSNDICENSVDRLIEIIKDFYGK